MFRLKQNFYYELKLNELKKLYFSKKETKDQRIRKLTDETHKLNDDAKLFSTNKSVQSFSIETKSNDIEGLRRQIRILEDKLKKQKQNAAERPYVEADDYKSRSKVSFELN